MTNQIPPIKSIVLYADDDGEDIELVQDAFAKYSANVEMITAGDGLEALAYLKNLTEEDPLPCLIILDINMPKMDGKEVLKRIRDMERFNNIPVVMFTTSALPLEKNFAEKYNAGFITKPIDQRQMEMIVKTFINHCSDEIQKKISK